MKTLLSELRRRNVFRVGLTYLVASWLVVQVVSSLVPILNVPEWVGKAVLIFLIAGFPISLVIAWAFELTPEGFKRSAASSVSLETVSSPAFGRKWDFAIIAVLVLALSYSIWDGTGERSGTAAEEAATTSAPVSAGGTAAPMPSLAVLPFSNLSPNEDQEYFADGLSEELLNELARLRGLQVVGQTSSFSFKNKNDDLREIGERLGVDNVLEGSVRKSGSEIRVSAQLVNAMDGYQIWSETYERTLDDVFALQDEISKSVATALSVKLGVGAVSRYPGMTRNVEAYDEYLRAKSASGLPPVRAFPYAIEHLQQAIALDPSFSLAWLELRRAYGVGSSNLPDRAAEWVPKAGAALQHAVELTPDSPPVMIAEADASQRMTKWREAGAFFDALPAVAAKYGDDNLVLLPTALFLVRVGRVMEAIEYLERAKAADPLNASVAGLLGNAYLGIGRVAAAVAEFDRAASFDKSNLRNPGNALLAALGTGERREIDERLAAMEIATRGSPGVDLNAAMAGFLDDPAGARNEIRRLAARDAMAGDPISTTVLAFWAAYFEDPELALDFLSDYAPLVRSGTMPLQMWYPGLREVRRLPGFKDLVREMGLVDYWRATGRWGDFCQPVRDDDFECE